MHNLKDEKYMLHEVKTQWIRGRGIMGCIREKPREKSENEADSKIWPGSLTWVTPRVGLSGSSGDAKLKKHRVRSVNAETRNTVRCAHTAERLESSQVTDSKAEA